MLSQQRTSDTTARTTAFCCLLSHVMFIAETDLEAEVDPSVETEDKLRAEEESARQRLEAMQRWAFIVCVISCISMGQLFDWQSCSVYTSYCCPFPWRWNGCPFWCHFILIEALGQPIGVLWVPRHCDAQWHAQVLLPNMQSLCHYNLSSQFNSSTTAGPIGDTVLPCWACPFLQFLAELVGVSWLLLYIPSWACWACRTNEQTNERTNERTSFWHGRSADSAVCLQGWGREHPAGNARCKP